MSATYKPILWNKFKRYYDLIMWGIILIYLVLFVVSNLLLFPQHNINTILIRAFGTLAIIMLHIILCIGPAARLNAKFLPVLYNRRHLGVSMFIIAATHGVLSLLWFHGGGNTPAVISLFTANTLYGSFLFFPFQTLGFLALMILAAMAFTSHDFWLNFLTPRFWKSLHMLVYIAYALVMMHVALGVFQLEQSIFFSVLLLGGFIVVALLHIIAGIKENGTDNMATPNDEDSEWHVVGELADFKDDRAKMAIIDKERIAVFKYDNKLSAVHNVCKHQMGPLGEGKIVDGCITCPWHGYQYRPEDGCAPAPFTEKLHTYPLKLIGTAVYVNVHPLPEGTYITPLTIPDEAGRNEQKNNPFFIGWDSNNDKKIFTLPKKIAIAIAVFCLLLSFTITANQTKITPFKIDYETIKKMEGWLTLKPVPMFTIIDKIDASGNPIYKNILLVDAFKNGAYETVQHVIKNNDRTYVQIKGYMSNKVVSCGNDSDTTCISVCTQCITGTTHFPLMEIENGVYSFKERKPAFMLPPPTLLPDKDTVMTGEIIDPKCYFGAMNPGYGKPHLSCASRCISGGIMPVLKYMDSDGEENYCVLTDDVNKINDYIIKYIGRTVSIKGRFAHAFNWNMLSLSKNSIVVK